MTAFHHAFSQALEGHFDDLWPHLDPDDRTLGAIAVYRNTAIKARIDALEANFPTVSRLVGDDWFRAAAREFVEDNPGDDPALAGFGEGFPAWLAAFEPALGLPYLSPMARLDRAWTEAHVAPDADPLTPARAAAAGLALTAAPARLHPSARLFWFDWTAPSLWLAHREPEGFEDLPWRPDAEGLLIHRPGAEVIARRLSRAEWAFLDAARDGRPFGAAALSARAAQPAVDASAVFAGLLAAGAFDSICLRSLKP
ncbi:hypothetical protein GCM10009116_07360 [Brevundimonas basaltis]|uniref:Putative DNA-binding domain-containing protein n=1 Tax=Brevundimonas basaltis TaxID=472166 RepID=A0A7W8HYN6_9CAUL|nr:DNA-binding domain-containing protein [Brevundimonas basaltis]MBB5292339.1 hypothetical protein [Brevundimonas basaltis]